MSKHRVQRRISFYFISPILRRSFFLTTEGHIDVGQIENGTPELENAYKRAVSFDGNEKAVRIMNDVFEPADVAWRGIGIIPGSGLKIRDEFSDYDAMKKFEISEKDSKEPKGCSCGEILTGLKTPVECPLYKKICTPVDPIGPCMVSSEGTCAAYYKYHGDDHA
ncbi:MAG: hypothetical protein KKE00_05840 [Proteobacteria bacterium]|nr:hypothetical protein [Pseudomonadota bacterium]MBU1570027.1 hypothetical protein [Pseudomonadota bacterium]